MYDQLYCSRVKAFSFMPSARKMAMQAMLACFKAFSIVHMFDPLRQNTRFFMGLPCIPLIADILLSKMLLT